jgi:tRNA pseudouridine55 synthase
MFVAASVSVPAAGGPPTPSSATTVKITSPLGRMGTSGKVRIVAQIHALPGAPLQSVQFWVDGALLATVSEPPYATTWDDANPFNANEITVAVTDCLGNTARDSVLLKPFEITEVTEVSSVLLEATVEDAKGTRVTTLDAEGDVTAERPVTATESDIRDAMSSLLGDSLQVPPAYSAVKVGGRKLYEAARRGEVLEAPARPIHVDGFELTALRGPDVDFRVTCSGGTYVRVLLADVGAALGCGAHLTRLRRTAIGALQATEGVEPSMVETPLPLERAVAHLPRLELSSEEAAAAGHGRVLGPAGIQGPYGVFAPGGALVGVYEDEGPKARPQVILAPSA